METTAKEYLQLKYKLNTLGLFQMETNRDMMLETVRKKEATLVIRYPKGFTVSSVYLSGTVSLVTALSRALDAELEIREVKKHNHEKSTYFIHCSELVEQLTAAAKSNKLEGKLRYLNRYSVLIIDEVGFNPFSPEAANYLFQLISRRYEKKSLIITTNKPLSQWEEVFRDPALANALLDRLLHHSKVIKIPGRSYRTRELISELEERRESVK